MNKKEFQTIIKSLRDELKYGDFPKAMMTNSQEAKRTATVNVGRTYWSHKPEVSRERSAIILHHSLFQDFLKKHNATAIIEHNAEGAQIRLYW